MSDLRKREGSVGLMMVIGLLGVFLVSEYFLFTGNSERTERLMKQTRDIADEIILLRQNLMHYSWPTASTNMTVGAFRSAYSGGAVSGLDVETPTSTVLRFTIDPADRSADSVEIEVTLDGNAGINRPELELAIKKLSREVGPTDWDEARGRLTVRFRKGNPSAVKDSMQGNEFF